MPAERSIGDVPVPSGPAEPVHSPHRASRRAALYLTVLCRRVAIQIFAFGCEEITHAG